MPPNGLPTGAIAVWTTSLNHESFNHSVEDQPIIIAFLGQLDEVLACFWCIIDEELNVNITQCCL